jgi:hypothetical protein
MKTILCDLMKEFGSDKSTWHSYTEVYNNIFEKFIGKNINLFEVGLGTNNIEVASNMGSEGKPGASLRAWKEYFKNANIYGADIDKNILFSEENIKTYYVDQYSDSDIAALWNNEDLKNIEFDIIIDDGIHELKGNINFLKNSLHKLKKGGYYVIEDIISHAVGNYEDSLKSLNCEYKILDLRNAHNSCDNILVIITI